MASLSVIACLLCLLWGLWRYLIYPAFMSPLSKLPNAHFSAPFSPLWILWKRYREEENRTIHAAHTKHGKIVRLGPNEVSVASVDDGIRVIYAGGFEKAQWYANQFDNYEVPCMFSMTSSRPHSLRKRMVTNLYSKTYVQSSVDFHKASEVIIYDRLLPLISTAADDHQSIDVLALFFRATMDFIGNFIWGLQNGTNFLQDETESTEWLRIYQSRRPYRFWQGELPGFIQFTKKIGLPIVPSWVDAANMFIENWCMRHCNAAGKSNEGSIQDLSTSADRSSAVVFDQLTYAVASAKTSDPYLGDPEKQVASEILDHVAAGHDTSGIALTFIFWELCKHPAIQTRLREELLTLSPRISMSQSQSGNVDRKLPPARAIDDLPFLHAILMESLRLHPSIPGSQPRITPSPPVSVAGSPLLDPGTRISTQPYTLHRNEDVFPQAEEWLPERWIEANREKKAEMMRWFWAFSSGSRMCIGSHVAMQEMKLIVASIYSNFTTHIVDDEGVEQVDGYTAGPKRGPLLRFEKVNA